MKEIPTKTALLSFFNKEYKHLNKNVKIYNPTKYFVLSMLLISFNYAYFVWPVKLKHLEVLDFICTKCQVHGQ